MATKKRNRGQYEMSDNIEEFEDEESYRNENMGGNIRKFECTKSDIQKFMKRTLATKEEIEKIKQIEQRTEEWYKARYYRITSSDFGKILGHFNSPNSQEGKNIGSERKKFIVGKIEAIKGKKFVTNAPMEWGTVNEKNAFLDIYEHYKSKEAQRNNLVSMNDVGLWVYDKMPFLGASLDGEITIHHEDGSNEYGNLEIKCPFRGQFYEKTPHHYYDQFQASCYIADKSFCDFVQWTISSFKIMRFGLNEEYCQNMFEELEKFYLEEFARTMIQYERGILDVVGGKIKYL